MFSKQTLQLLIILLISASVLLVFQQEQIDTADRDTQTSNETRPTAFAENATITLYRESGPSDIAISSKRSEYFSDTKRVELYQPLIEFHDSKQQKYNLSAKQGRYLLDEERVLLQGDVQLRSAAQSELPDTASSLTLDTQALSYDTRARLISTEEPVIIIYGRHQLESVGLNVELDSKKLSLLSNVKGRYVIDPDNS